MNAKFTKLNKNYVVLATLIAALGVIFALFFAINSFADDNSGDANNEPVVAAEANADAQEPNAEYNYTFTGTAKLYTGAVIPSATVQISRATTPSGYVVFATGTTDASGNFSIDATTDAGSMNIVVDVHAGGTNTKGIGGYTEESTVSSGTVALGDITCHYLAYLSYGTNPYGDEYGVWSEWMTDHWVEVGSSGGPSGFYYKGDATFAVENTNQIRISFTNRFDNIDSKLYKFDAYTPYTLDSFTFTNGQQQEITGPNITTGYLSMIANCSGQSITHTFSGKFVTPSGSAVSNATVYILANGGSFQTTTNASGEFSKAITVMGASIKITYLGFDLIGDKTKSSISYHEYGDPLYELTADQDAGTLTCYYACGLMEEINGQYTQSNVYGTWSIPAEANDGGVYTLTFNSCEVTVDENKVKFNYVDEKGAAKEWVWTFTANPGYEFQNFTFNKEDSPVFDNASVVDLTTSLFWGINANVQAGSHTDCTFTGKVIDGYGNGLGGLDVMITLSCTGGPSPWITGTTDVDGTFSITYSIDDTKTYKLYMLSASKMQAENELGINGYQILDIPFTIGDYNFEDLTVEYYGSFIPYINNQETTWNVDKSWFENAYGHWAWASNANNGTPFDFTFSKTGEYEISGDTITATFLQGTGGSTTTVMTYTFVPNYPYVSSGVNVTPLISSDENGTSINSNMRFDGNVEMAKHTVHYSGTIDKVTANGEEIAKDSDVEVTHGAVIIVFPTYTDDKVTKVTINGNYAYSTVADKDLNIIGFQEDAVTISGRVTSDAVSQNCRGSLNLASLFIDTAYADEVGVADALVQFTQEDGWSTGDMTDAEGYFDLDVVKGAAGVLTISKEGYNTYTKEFTAEELSEDVEVAPVLTVAAQPENVNGSAQTGDNMPYGIVLAVLAVSAFAVYRTARRPKGAHVK